MEQAKHIILFDGECNFCSFWVKYVIKRDAKNVFRFASLQSEKGRELLDQYQIDSSIESLVLIQHENVYFKSSGALHIVKALGGFSSIFYGLIVIPRFIRDFFYDMIASVRYKIFGKSACELPADPNYKDRFL